MCEIEKKRGIETDCVCESVNMWKTMLEYSYNWLNNVIKIGGLLNLEKIFQCVLCIIFVVVLFLTFELESFFVHIGNLFSMWEWEWQQ